MLPHGVYEIHKEEGKAARATGSNLKLYKSSDAYCIEMKIKVLHKEIVVSKSFILVYEDHTIKRYL